MQAWRGYVGLPALGELPHLSFVFQAEAIKRSAAEATNMELRRS